MQQPWGGHAIRRGEPADPWIGVIDGLVKMAASQPGGRMSTFTGVTAGGLSGRGFAAQARPLDRLFGPQARLARCLASLFDPDLCPRADDFIRLSQEEIGLLLGVSRQRTHEALHALEKAGLL